jgi:hypothetical protein
VGIEGGRGEKKLPIFSLFSKKCYTMQMKTLSIITTLSTLILLSSCGGSTTEPTGWYKPTVQTTWQWQLSGTVNTQYAVDLYDIDLFDSDASLIKTLHTQGKKVICYFSAGSYEEWRTDSDSFPVEVLGKELDGWAGERWLDIRSQHLYPIMRARLDLAKSKGCDGVEPDNVDGYTNETGFPLTGSEQLAYNRFLAAEAHSRGLSIGLKNDLNQIISLEPYFDFAVNEQCHEYEECMMMQPFIDADKPVLNAEYAQKYVDNSHQERDTLCTNAQQLKYQTLILPLFLDDTFRITCD